jgi:arsenate reductase (glutaredoxin)
MSTFKIYHNPRCSKSCATLALLRNHGIEPEIIEYLVQSLTAALLRELVEALGIKPEQLIRKGEDVFKSKYAGRALTDAEWIDAMIDDPILIERPIVVKGTKAVVGRPPENVLQLL